MSWRSSGPGVGAPSRVQYSRSASVSGACETQRSRVPRVLGRCTPEGGRTRLVGSTSNPAWYVQQVAALECGFTVLGGAALVDAARALAARVAASVSG